MKMRYILFLLLKFIILYHSIGQPNNIKSKLEIYNIETHEQTVLYEENVHFEAPNWSTDGRFMLINGGGKLYRFDLATQQKTLINTGLADKLNNDHGISPDGKHLVISHYDAPNVKYEDRDFKTSRIYTLPIEGGTPKVITSKTPSFWHGWSPDGQTLIYTALRNDNFDIYVINVNGGIEIRLTDHEGLDDGSDFSSDGKHIYYNSMQSGKMEIWRMNADGSQKVQLTDDRFSNWFPHPSPDGQHMVFLSYLEDQGSSHPAMKKVALRLMNLKDQSIKTLCYLTGGQGTINVPSWSPDGKQFAFVSYEYINQSVFDSDYIYAFVDNAMPATGYIDGKLNEDRFSKDELVVLKNTGQDFETVSRIAVSNSVRRWPNSASMRTIDQQKYILVAEQDGQAAPTATSIQDISQAKLLTLIDVTDAKNPFISDTLTFKNIPTCVVFHPNEDLFALTFLGTDSIAIGTVKNGKISLLHSSKMSLPNETIPAIPHFTWHPSGQFAAISLAGNNKLMFLKFDSSNYTFEQWGNSLKTAPLPGVGYFNKDGQFYIQTVINLTADLEQDAYKDNTSLLNIYRFDDNELPNSMPTRNNDGQSIYESPDIKHTLIQNSAFGEGYVETFAISPDDKYIIGLNMRGSWLPKERIGHTETASLEFFKFQNGKAKKIGTYPFKAVLPECILFDPSGEGITVTDFGQHNGKSTGSLIFWQLLEEARFIHLVPTHSIPFPRGLHYLIAK